MLKRILEVRKKYMENHLQPANCLIISESIIKKYEKEANKLLGLPKKTKLTKIYGLIIYKTTKKDVIKVGLVI